MGKALFVYGAYVTDSPKPRRLNPAQMQRVARERFYEALERNMERTPVRVSDDQFILREQILAHLTKKVDQVIDSMRLGQAVYVDLVLEVINSDGSFRDTPNARNAPEARQWRSEVFARDQYTCQECGAKGKLNAHHIEPWATAKYLRFDINNGVTLCVNCHALKHPGRERVILAERRRKQDSAAVQSDT